MKTSITKNNLFKLLLYLLVAAVFLLIWEITALSVANEYFFPTLKSTFSALIKLGATSEFYISIALALLRVAIGLAAGTVAGIFFGTVSYLIPIAREFIAPMITVMKATPIAAIILILWFSMSDATLAIFVVFLMVTPIIWQNVYDGYRNIPNELKEVGVAYEIPFPRKLRILIVPSVAKYLIPAFITSIGLAWKAEIAAEIMTYSNIGKSINDFKTLTYDTASVYAWAVTIVVMSMILEGITKRLLRRRAAA